MKLAAAFTLIAALSLSACASQPTTAALPAVTNATSPAPGIISAGRLTPADVEHLRVAGIRQVIDLTPDAETPDFDEATTVRDAGLAYANLPVHGADGLTLENARAFDALLRDAKRPVVVHCSSGNRVGAMAALRAAWVEGKSAEEAIAIGKTWGLKGLEGKVRERLDAGPAPATD
jgi:uncharacterized protein (TIGR01244 family)